MHNALLLIIQSVPNHVLILYLKVTHVTTIKVKYVINAFLVRIVRLCLNISKFAGLPTFVDEDSILKLKLGH